ncbi:MAG: HIT family protein [Lachnospiraceae bacterium]|nr:HIT family protein [Lachnospiraceae bacterium]
MVDNNCIFCKLANGDIPTNSIYEDDNFKVILDNAPATKGHALILPKSHYKNLYELPEDTAAEVMKLAKKMAVSMTEKLGCEGFNLLQNNNEVAGQTVFHFHMHLIPRYADDNQHLVMPPMEMTPDELVKVRDELAM